MTRTTAFRVAAGLLIGGLGSTSTRAALTVYEPFNYSGTTLGGQSGAATGMFDGWVDNATPPVGTTVPAGGYAGSSPSGGITLSGDATSLAFPNATTSGARVSDSDGGYSTRTLSAPLNLNTNATYYVSALIRGSGVVQFDNPTFSIYSFGIQNGQFVSMIRDIAASTNGQTYNDGQGTYNANTTYLMVAKVVALGTGNDTAQLSIYDPTMVVPSVEPTVFDRTSAVGSGQSGTRLGVISFTGVSNQVDEIRVGTTWLDVAAVPEPASGAAGLIAAGCLLCGRRRKPRIRRA